MAQVTIESFLRVRIAAHEAHYGGGLVDGARVLSLFGDAVTELMIRHDGDEGLFRAYESIEFLAPVYAGDFLEIRAKIVEVGHTSRQVECTAHKVIRSAGHIGDSAAETLAEPVLVCRAVGTAVVPLEKQRRGK
jgi:3-aminobutyryl-CoA ammonia-lyase